MTEIVYTDRLVEITRETIKFRHYYFPFGAKTINIGDIETVETLDPSLLSGKWRIHGTGDFRTWFPRDLQRPKRDAIFVLFLRKRWRRIGFTVER